VRGERGRSASTEAGEKKKERSPTAPKSRRSVAMKFIVINDLSEKKRLGRRKGEKRGQAGSVYLGKRNLDQRTGGRR